MPLSMNHSPIAAPANGARYWFAADSEAGAATMMVYGIAPAASRAAINRAMVDSFWPIAT